MVITYLGKQFFKLTQGDMTIAFNPISKDSKSGVKPSKFGANIALVTTNHPDFNGAESLAFGDTIPFIVDGPGDYEVQDIFIHGEATQSKIGKDDYVNTVYTVTVDGISIAFFGSLSEEKLSANTREAIGSPEVIFIPIGGKDTIGAQAAYKLASSFEASIIIPMDFGKDSITTFLKEAGQSNQKPVDKLTLKSKDLIGKEGEVVVLKG